MPLILLTHDKLFVNGSVCESVTVYQRDGRYEVVMFGNQDHVKTKTRIDKWGKEIKYQTGKKLNKIWSKVIFDKIIPLVKVERQEPNYWHAKNKNNNYINFYGENPYPSKQQKVGSV